MKSNSEPSFTVVDKRGQAHIETGKPKTIEAPATLGDKSTWKNVAYLVALIPGGQGNLIVAGRAVGLRSDGKPFVADYILPPVWPKDLNWTEQAKKRLDTFLGCDCNEHGPCAVHKVYLLQWVNADTQRLQLMASQPVPEAVEVLMRAEQSRAQSRIVVPR